MDDGIFIKTKRLTLRNLHRSDWKGLQSRCGTKDVADTLLSIDYPWTEVAIMTWIDAHLWRGTSAYRLVICLDGKLIGTVGFAGTAGKFGLGYFLGSKYWGQGYAFEASKAFLDDAFERFDIPEIKSAAMKKNPASHRILQKLGFEKIGEGMSPQTATLEPEPEVRYRLTEQKFKAVTHEIS